MVVYVCCMSCAALHRGKLGEPSRGKKKEAIERRLRILKGSGTQRKVVTPPLHHRELLARELPNRAGRHEIAATVPATAAAAFLRLCTSFVACLGHRLECPVWNWQADRPDARGGINLKALKRH